ncbi:uncharacterized protein [Periplaneta americana]|uniref:uncharacterized protein n=1 Tax=Periplaneta americana TaxID=6978 RepID=UPI0037E8CFE6
MCKVAQVLEGVPVGEFDGVCVCDIPLFKYAHLTSCDVERSFSHYKSLFTDNRHAFVMENLEMTFVVHCNSRPTTSTQVWLVVKLKEIAVIITGFVGISIFLQWISCGHFLVGNLVHWRRDSESVSVPGRGATNSQSEL